MDHFKRHFGYGAPRRTQLGQRRAGGQFYFNYEESRKPRLRTAMAEVKPDGHRIASARSRSRRP